jgi:hypothetical protein
MKKLPEESMSSSYILDECWHRRNPHDSRHGPAPEKVQDGRAGK